MSNHYPVHITTLTPVAIGGGQGNLSPYSDYVIHNGMCYYIHQKKLAAALAEQPRLMDEYMMGMRHTDNNQRPKLDLKAFITGKLNKPLEEMSMAIVKARGFAAGDKLELQQMSKTAGKAYIPGSSLKGACRTAILYKWISDPGKEIFKNLLKRIEDTYSRTEKDLEALIEELQADRPNKEAVKRLRRTISDAIGQTILPFYENEIEKRVFPNAREMNNLRFTDTSGLPLAEAAEVERTARKSLYRTGNEIPVAREALRSGLQTHTTLTIIPNFRGYLAFLNAGHAALFNCLQAFTNDIVANESNYVNDSRLNDIDKSRYNHLFDFYEGASFDPTNGACAMRIGSGKTYFWNTIGLAIWRVDEIVFQQYRRLFEIGLIDSDNFPLTMIFTEPEDEQLGWVQLELIQ